jgi:hypothetical protein
VTRRMRTGVLFAVLLASLSVGAPAAAADQRAAAQVLFEQGKALVERGDFADACPKFAESLRLDTGTGTMLWLADCLENNGQTASAWAQFKEAAAAAALAHDARESVARDRAKSLEKRLSWVAVVVPTTPAAVPGLQVQRDGVVVGAAEWGVAVPVDPGVHAFSASAPGRREWRSTVNVPVGPTRLAVTIPALDASPADTSAAAPASASPGPSPRERARGSGRDDVGHTQRVVGVVVGGVGLAGVALGGFFGIGAKSRYDESNTGGHCVNDACDAFGKRARSDASGQALVSTVAFIAGGAALAGGIALYLTAPSSSSSLALTTTVGPQDGLLVVRGAF